MRAELPTGWKREKRDGGEWRIIPGEGRPRSSGLWLAAAGLACCVAGGFVFASLSQGGGWRGLRLTVLLPVGLFLIGWGLGRALGREEWWIDADRLEIRHTFLAFRRARRFHGATLRLISAAGGGSSPRQRALVRASRSGQRPVHTGGGWWGLYVQDGSGMLCLGSSSRGFSGKEELQNLGEWLCEKTGWPLTVGPSRRKR
jgi:hypothetical protein